MKLLILGATGLVGQQVLQQALADPDIEQVVAPTRRTLPVAPGLSNPIVDFDRLPTEADWWQVDGIVLALGTTLRQTGSRAAYRRVDYDYSLLAARCARSRGTPCCALVSSLGADADAGVFYPQLKGELELALRQLEFESLTLVRPALLDGGWRTPPRPLESLLLWVTKAVSPLLPARYRPVSPRAVAQTLLSAIKAAQPGVKLVESEAIR